MTPRPSSSADRDVEILVAATAGAHAAGVCGSLLRDHIEDRCAAGAGAELIATGRTGRFAEIAAAAERFETAVIDTLADLEPHARLSAAAIAETARDLARASLVEKLYPSLGIDSPATRRGGLR